MTDLPTRDQIDAFNRDGVVLLKGVFADYVDDARAAIEENKANPSWRERTYRPDDGKSPFFQDYVVWDQFDGYRRLVRDSAMGEIAAKLMGSKTARVTTASLTYRVQGPGVWGLGLEAFYAHAGQDKYFSIGISPFSRFY